MPSIPKPKKRERKKVKKPTLAKMRKILDRLWFEAIYARDKGTCQKCGRKDTLAAHHIFGKKAYPAGRWLIDNGMLLCYACHIHWAHSKPYEVMYFWIKSLKINDPEKANIAWYSLAIAMNQKLQFRSCDFETIKTRLEKEKACMESSVK